jgi:uncharacterized surface anchored protein
MFVLLDLLKTDTDELKKRTAVGTNITSFITITESLATDMSLNPIVSVTNGDAMKASDYVVDSTDPILISFEIDMDSAVIKVNFDETIDVSSFDPTEMRLQSVSASSFAVCPCTECADGTFAGVTCTAKYDTICQTCTTCPNNQFVDAACTAVKDTQCKDCSTCTGATYVGTLCAGSKDTECGSCENGCSKCTGPGSMCV